MIFMLTNMLQKFCILDEICGISQGSVVYKACQFSRQKESFQRGGFSLSLLLHDINGINYIFFSQIEFLYLVQKSWSPGNSRRLVSLLSWQMPLLLCASKNVQRMCRWCKKDNSSLCQSLPVWLWGSSLVGELNNCPELNNNHFPACVT